MTADDAAGLEAFVATALVRGRAAHPGVVVDDAVFARHVARCAAAGEGPGDAALASLRVEDLYLAQACALGDTVALARFEALFLSKVPAFVAHLQLDAVAIDELMQALRERLVAAGDGAKILGYRGRGPLGGWLRVSAVRLALTLRAKSSPGAGGDEFIAAATAAPDPELLLARLHAGQAFKSAFEASVASLNQEERTVLRMHFIDGLSIDEIAVAYGLHRSTAARRLAAGKEKVADRTRRTLRATLKLDAGDLDSVLRLVDSQMGLSLARVLGDAPSDPL